MRKTATRAPILGARYSCSLILATISTIATIITNTNMTSIATIITAINTYAARDPESDHSSPKAQRTPTFASPWLFYALLQTMRTPMTKPT